MPLDIPTSAEQYAIYLANFETRLNQTSPLADEAFLRVLSAIESLVFTTLYKYAAERSLQNLALTATGDDLDKIGNEIGIVRKAATAAQLRISLPALTGTYIPIATAFVGDSNGVRYFSNAEAYSILGFASIEVTAHTLGVIGNLNVSDTLQIATQIPGAESQAFVILTSTAIGADKETDTAYRLRVLNGLRTTLGGGNSEDYKTWSEEVAGVFRAFPYGGKPISSVVDSLPGDRTVYIEADTSVDPDGIAPSTLLDSVRENIHTDPITGLFREPLGMIDATLYIESIYRTPLYIEITNEDIPSTIVTQVKADIETALDLHFRSIAPFVQGIDFEPDENDIVTSPTVSTVVQDVLKANSSACDRVRFGLSVGTYLDRYDLEPGQLAKLGSVTYV